MNKNNKDNQYLADIKLSELNKEYLIKEGYKYCLIYYLNDLIFGDIDKIEEINKDILLEGFFFNEKQELHIFKNEDFYDEDGENNTFKLVKTIDNGCDKFTEEFVLKKRLGNNLIENKYDKVEVINYLGYEDDGQAYIKYTALKKVLKKSSKEV